MVVTVLPTATRPFLEVPPAQVRRPNVPVGTVVDGGVSVPPEGPGPFPIPPVPATPVPVTPPTQSSLGELTQPVPRTPVVPVYPRKQARH